MRNYKYMRLATGCLAAGGGLGILIPPSGVLIMYGIMTQQSISKLFIVRVAAWDLAHPDVHDDDLHPCGSSPVLRQPEGRRA
jgi:hypothetical protein